ncbi:MAG TPA: outer membrane beta-barrel protein [Candidatus Limnocylindrales bacterium]|nr:outer membrane beta-barrel protein [Candidatus Limnocylindrales bacterium]
MRKIIALFGCALGLFAVSGPGYAAETTTETTVTVQESGSPDYAKDAIYVGLDGLAAIDDGFNSNRLSGGVGVRAGWRLHPHVALEADYNFYHDLNPDEEDGWSASANVKPYVLTGRFQPFFLAGLGYLQHEPSGDFVFRFGFGFDACLTEHWAVGPEIAYLVAPESDEDNIFTFALGITYKATVK